MSEQNADYDKQLDKSESMNKRKLMALLVAAFTMCTVEAQTALKKVYDENINPMEQIDKALAQAAGAGKYVICQVGGNWCPWCLRFADFITTDSVVSKVVADNYVYIHVNYRRNRAADAERAALTDRMMQRLGSPARFGFPVLVVLDEKGKVIHTQDSSFLEEGKGYDREKVLRFFRAWTPAAVRGE